jgi:enoyl-CoA hydratase/carnithine racemase
MAGPAVLVAVRNQRMVITLNRPDQLNAQNEQMRTLLVDALEQFDDDDELRVAILHGAGRAFSAGADLKEGPPRDGTPARNRHFDRLDTCRKPLIACMHGYAVGGGLEVALCCDIRVATVDAQLGTPEARTTRGLPGIAVHRLGRVIPLGEALRIMLTGQPIDGRRAFDIGLVQAVADDHDSMMQVADALADQIIECNPQSMETIKRIARTPVELEVAMSQRLARNGRVQMPRREGGHGARYLAERKARAEGRP